MSEGTNKVEKTEQEAKAAELTKADLDKVAGGIAWSGSTGGDDSPTERLK